jgi:hypothetical protein
MEQQLAQAKNFVEEHAFTLGLGLLLAAIIAAAVWFWMSRNGSGKSVLENNARVNDTTTAPEDQVPTQEQLEEMARHREQAEAQQQAQGDNQVPSDE